MEMDMLFKFFVHDKASGLIFFVGHVVNPFPHM